MCERDLQMVYICMRTRKTPPPRHTSLLVVGRYDSILSFGRISLIVRLDGNTRQSFTLVRTLAVEEKAYSWYCILVIGVCTKYT